ncbi:sensor histidine kinase [Devosia naphthalenivorans]|uniref:sensor histidine kinase n=1 Tax=Devosia naphthalenivorans TaxID=2082392 RepID=UPI000D34AD27|nr:CHASE3 domain-containing protein [Devosia naphthalenivorans]
MPISSNAFVRSTALLLLVGFVALLAIVGTTIWLVEQNQNYFNITVEARSARTAAINLRNAMQDAETGQRGYMLTGEQSYLEPYNEAVPKIPQLLEELKIVLAPYPDSVASVREVEGAIVGKLEEMSRTIELVRNGQSAEALATLKTDQGKALMDKARALFDGIIDAADRRISDGNNNQRGATNALRWVTIISAVVIIAVVGGSAWTVLSYTRELASARHEVETANSSLEERVRERTSDLGRANEEIQRFAYIVTHDLRAPLVNIMGFTSELETSVGLLSDYMAKAPEASDPAFEEARLAATEDLPEAITFIRAATRKMDGLINAILKISREGRRQLKPETINLPEFIEANADAVHHQVADTDGTVRFDVQLPKIVSDKLSLEQVLGNLLDNAIKYRHPDRPIEIALRARQALGNRVEITVEDNGRGIADSDHERVFELFRRSGAQSQPGEGIGLAHVRTLVRSLGGDITLRSKLGEGTTFTITLPRDLRSHLGRQTA